VQQFLPICWNSPGRTWSRLVERMVTRPSEGGSTTDLLGGVVPEPLFAWLEALNDRVSSGLSVRRGVLSRRGVTAANVATFGAAPQVEPPSTIIEALSTAGPAWRRFWIDLIVWHLPRIRS
jgi:hypothetical protein